MLAAATAQNQDPYTHIITGGQDEWLGGVNDDGSNVVWMRFKGGDLL